MKECRPMYEYSWFIQRIKEYLGAGWVRDEAIKRASQGLQSRGSLDRVYKESWFGGGKYVVYTVEL